MKDLIKKLQSNQQVISLMGPTASGKSRLSMALAEVIAPICPVEIISVDSALIYRDMDIGTAKPTPAERTQVPHHLIDILPPTESYSAADFVADSKRLVQEVFARGHLPILVGGTMMYFNALQKGLSKLPEADEAIRAKWLSIWEKTPEALHQALSKVDPEAAQRIHPNDPQRLIRALEVYEVSGRPLTELQKEGVQPLTEFKLLKFGLMPEDRGQLHQQIEKRFMQMLEQGFLDEVQQLKQTYPELHPDLPSMRSVGYRQAWDYLDGKIDRETFIHKGVVATRQLAKRQITWLRKEFELIEMDPFQLSLEQQLQKVTQQIADANPEVV